MEGGKKVSLCRLLADQTEDREFVEKMRFGASHSTSNKLFSPCNSLKQPFFLSLFSCCCCFLGHFSCVALKIFYFFIFSFCAVFWSRGWRARDVELNLQQFGPTARSDLLQSVGAGTELTVKTNLFLQNYANLLSMHDNLCTLPVMSVGYRCSRLAASFQHNNAIT